MAEVRNWIVFTTGAMGAAAALILAYDYLTAHYGELQEPWFFIFLITVYSLGVALVATIFGESLVGSGREEA